MAEIKNHFISGKMNKDIEDRLIKDSEYRDALNITVGKAGENNVGSIENIKSNVLAYATSLGYLNAQPIGYIVDEKDNSIYWFVTTFYFNPGVKEYPGVNDYCAILKFNQTNSSFSTVLERKFLRFCHKHLITGVNIIDNYLFWTDNFNQPRRIDLTINESFYNYDEQLSIPRCAPYLAPTVLIKNDSGTIVNSMQQDALIESNFLKERFVRFSYRFKFADNSYSTIAPFTQVLFIPKKFFETTDIVSTYKTTENVCMVNIATRLICKIELPSHYMYKDYFVKGIDILLKQSDSTVIRSIDYIDIKNYNDQTSTRYNNNNQKVNDVGNGNIFYYEYKSNVPSTTLPESQYLRVWDKVPRLAKAQELAGSRIVYGNYLENYNLPELDYYIDYVDKDDHNFWLEHPHHSVKQSRSYQVGIVLTDIVGRSSSVIITKNSVDSHVFVPYVNTAQPNVSGEPWHGLALQINFRSTIPDPYSVKTLLFTTNNTKFTSETYNTSTKLYDYVFNFNISSQLSIGDWLLGNDGNHVRIFAVNASTISTEGKINAVYGSNWWTTNPVSKVYKYKINKNGWHSYKVVVKQKQQDYYNVYTPAVVNYKDRSWITLHSDNINKVPRDLTMTGRQDGTYASSTTLYAKVVKNRFPVSNFTGSTHTQKGSIQFLNVAFPISVVSIGTASDQKIQVTTGTAPNTVTANAKWLYESDKDHLLAEIEDNCNLDGECNYGLYVDYIPAANPPGVPRVNPLFEFNNKQDGTDQHEINDAHVHLGVFETKPVESLLDIFWESSTSDLVENLNFDIINFSSTTQQENPDLPGEIPPENIVNPNGVQVDYFYESDYAGLTICRFNAIQNADPIVSYELNRVYKSLISGTTGDTTDDFGLLNITGYANIYIINPSYYKNNSASSGVYNNKFYFEIKINTASGLSVLRTFVLYLKNSNPYTFNFKDNETSTLSRKWGKFTNLWNTSNYLDANLNADVKIASTIFNNRNGFQSGNGYPLSPVWSDDVTYKIDSCTMYDYLGNILNIPVPIKLIGGGESFYFAKIDEQYAAVNVGFAVGDFATALQVLPNMFGGNNGTWHGGTLAGRFDPRIKVMHIVVSSRDCNGNTGFLTNGTNSSVITPVTNKYEFWTSHTYRVIDDDRRETYQGALTLQKYELTHPTVVGFKINSGAATRDYRLYVHLYTACGSSINHTFSKRNIKLGTVYKFIDNKWWLCDYYYFKSNTTAANSTPSNNGYALNGYFYMEKVEIVSPTVGSTTGSIRQGNIITSYVYGKNDGNNFAGPANQTLIPGANKQFRSILITTHSEAGMANSWGCYMYKLEGSGTNEYQIIVEWDNTTGIDDISKIYLLKTLY